MTRALLRQPVLRSRGDADYQRLIFIEDLSGPAGMISYTPHGEPRADFLRFAYLTPDGEYTVGTLEFEPGPEPAAELDRHGGIEPSDGSVVDWAALGGSLEFTWDAAAAFDNIRVRAYQGGQKFLETDKAPWTNPYTEQITPPDPNQPVTVLVQLHKGAQCIDCDLEYLPTGNYEAVQRFTNYDVADGVALDFTFADLVTTDGPDIGEFVLIVPPEHGHAVFPAPVLQPEGHPILIPARQGVVTVGADVTPQYTLSEYHRIVHRDQGNWQDWPSGPPAGYTVDAVLGSCVAVRQSAGGGILELSA